MKKLPSIIIAVFLSLSLLAVPASAVEPFVVDGTMDPAVDVPTVQYAVDNYDRVLLRGSFSFGMSTVVITKDVEIKGEDATIYGGFWTFYAPLPFPTDPSELLDFYENGPGIPGPKITIKNIWFDGAMWTPIHIAYTSGVEIKNNKITNVIPSGPWTIFGRPGSYWQGGAYVLSSFMDPRGDFATVIPGAITGSLLFKNNEVDLEVYPPYPPRSPEDTMGQGLMAAFTWGAFIEMKGNTITNVTKNSIEVLENYTDESGNGSIVIRNNRIVAAETGIPVPTQTGPNGIIAGWFFGPAGPVEYTPETTIRGNHVEARGEFSWGIGILSPGQLVEGNWVTVGDGGIPGSTGAGISVFGEDAVVRENKITVNHTTGVYGASGAGILGISDNATIVDNQIILDEESMASGILQDGSDGLIASNKIKGHGDFAIFLIAWDIYTPENNLISDNDIEKFTHPEYTVDVAFVFANNNTLYGKGGTVLDYFSSGNEFYGDWVVTVIP